MITHILTALLWGASCGLIGAVYRSVLAYEEPFSAWWRFGARYEHRWFFRPVWACEKCFAGQLALWSYFIHALKIAVAMRPERIPGVSASLQGYSIGGHAAAICAAIFSAVIFARAIDQKNRTKSELKWSFYTAGLTLVIGVMMHVGNGTPSGLALGFIMLGAGLLTILFTAIV